MPHGAQRCDVYGERTTANLCVCVCVRAFRSILNCHQRDRLRPKRARKFSASPGAVLRRRASAITTVVVVASPSRRNRQAELGEIRTSVGYESRWERRHCARFVTTFSNCTCNRATESTSSSARVAASSRPPPRPRNSTAQIIRHRAPIRRYRGVTCSAERDKIKSPGPTSCRCASITESR